MDRRTRIATWIAGGVGAVIMIGVLSFCMAVLGPSRPDSDPQPEPPPVAEGFDGVRGLESAELVDGTLTVSIRVINAWTEADHLNLVADSVAQVGEAMRDEPAGRGSAETVWIITRAPGTDRLGQPTEVALFELEFAGDDLRAAHFEGLPGGGALNLAQTVVSSPQARSAGAIWCADDYHARRAPGFCAQLGR